MTDPQDRPPADLERYLAPARRVPPADPAAKAALLARVVASIEGPPGGGDGGDGGGEPAVPASTTPAPPAALTWKAVALSGKAGALAAATFALGAASGVALDRTLHRPEVRVVVVERPAQPQAGAPSAATAPSAPTAPTPSLPALPPVASLPAAPRPPLASAEPRPPAEPHPSAAQGPASALPPASAAASSSAAPQASAPAAGKDAELAAERVLLERARSALARGNASGALEALARHASEHPRGRMSEEREALWIQALVTAGRVGEARQRLERYRASFPRSFSLPALEAAVGER